ncbi:hypothetical protein [Pelagicoccus albus]|uniref:VOC domain-containing protein n=1 Tax=Pelagicoccus albus TaxID=415222 RepID=A0A7X1B4N7_9BACT|nr:hypothetical protein [Pelagicoccus albus]MBC2605609.1 hypothetical protein [Pelagicoccus albus]
MQLYLDHIAILTDSVEVTADSLPSSLTRFPIESFESEGTREQYIELSDRMGTKLLLIEATGVGPYSRTMAKRGPGLHHFGYITDELDEAVKYFARWGMLLHPISMETMKRQTVWMCRPEVPFLIELSHSETKEKPMPDAQISIGIAGSFSDIIWLPGMRLTGTNQSEVSLRYLNSAFSLANTLPSKRYKVIEDHKASFSEFPQVKKGEKVIFKEIDPNNSAWFSGTAQDGTKGYFPRDWFYRETTSQFAFALLDYDARELNASTGEIVNQILEYGDWLLCSNQSGEGWIPKKNIEQAGR